MGIKTVSSGLSSDVGCYAVWGQSYYFTYLAGGTMTTAARCLPFGCQPSISVASRTGKLSFMQSQQLCGAYPQSRDIDHRYPRTLVAAYVFSLISLFTADSRSERYQDRILGILSVRVAKKFVSKAAGAV